VKYMRVRPTGAKTEMIGWTVMKKAVM